MTSNDSVARALRFVQQEFPLARAAFLGGNAAAHNIVPCSTDLRQRASRSSTASSPWS